jgi:hypothetical protein
MQDLIFTPSIHGTNHVNYAKTKYYHSFILKNTYRLQCADDGNVILNSSEFSWTYKYILRSSRFEDETALMFDALNSHL